MSAFHRIFLSALAAPALLFGVCSAQPDWARRVNLDVWNVPRMERQMDETLRGERRIEEDQRALQGQSDRRGRLADDVAAGRLGLFEAAARFRDLNDTNPRGKPDLRLHFAGATEEERCCRQVIGWVKIRLESRSDAEARPTVCRLEQELDEQLRREGEVRLPQ